MSFSCLKLLLALNLFVIITEGQRVDRRSRKLSECRNDLHCSSRSSCIKTRGGRRQICVRTKASAANEAPSEEAIIIILVVNR